LGEVGIRDMLTHRAYSRVSRGFDKSGYLSLQIGCISKRREMFCTIAPGRAKCRTKSSDGSVQRVKRPLSASRVLLNKCLAVVGESELYSVSSHVVLNPARSGHSSLADLPLSIPPPVRFISDSREGTWAQQTTQLLPAHPSQHAGHSAAIHKTFEEVACPSNYASPSGKEGETQHCHTGGPC
jgi:hypothetical protein